MLRYCSYGEEKTTVLNLFFSNCSIIEALNYIEEKTKVRIKKILKRENRIGDHIWYVSSMKKFKRHYPKWKQKYNTNKIIDELIKNFDY